MIDLAAIFGDKTEQTKESVAPAAPPAEVSVSSAGKATPNPVGHDTESTASTASGGLAAYDTGATGNQANAAAGQIWRHGEIEPPDPCPDCGGLLCWWNPLDERRCLRCSPPRTAIRLLERVQQIRQRHGIRNPRGAKEILATMKRLTDT